MVSSLVTKSSEMIKNVSGYIVIRGMWLCVIAAEKAGGSCRRAKGLDDSSHRTLGWRLLFVRFGFVTGCG